MRELWQTGWMQQSVRMVCASFLTEYLSIHWVEGEDQFNRLGRGYIPGRRTVPSRALTEPMPPACGQHALL